MSKPADTDKLHKTIVSFLHKIESLKEAVPLMMGMLFIEEARSRLKLSNFLEEHGEEIENTDQHKRYKLPIENGLVASRLEEDEKRAQTASSILPSKMLVSFITEYDAYLGNLLRVFFHAKPELFQAKEKSISYDALQQLGSIDNALDHIIEKEIESFLRNSHVKQFKSLESTFHTPLTKGLDSWGAFIEITERRNLFVHCDGNVSSAYLKNCKKHGAVLEPNIGLGTRLDADVEYLDNAYRCLYEISVKLNQVLWRRQFKCRIAEADSSLIEISYRLIHAEDYQLAIKILDFATETLTHWASDYNRRLLIINRAQAYYHSGDLQTCKDILSGQDWSSCADEFQLCTQVLQEDYESAILTMERIGTCNKVSDADYLDWPVFRKFRESSAFKKTFMKIFGKKPVNVTSLVKNPKLDEVIDKMQSDLETLNEG